MHTGRFLGLVFPCFGHVYTDTFGTCRVVGFPTNDRDTHVLS
jgi:hypothetical protein